MRTIVIGSLKPGAGKTSVIVGIAGNLENDFGYIKPLGERVIYKKKRLLDHDSALIKHLFDLDQDPEDMSIGFDHSKLRYMYDKESLENKLLDMKNSIGADKDILIVEAGRDLIYGSSVGLDAFSIARMIGGELIIVVSGDDDSIVDDLTFIKEHINIQGIEFKGVIINKVKDLEEFRDIQMDKVEELGMKVLGILPFSKEMTYLSMRYISDVLFAKVLAGESALSNQVKEIYIGAMSGDAALKNPLFSKGNKLIITSGDREDMCLAALRSDTAGIILTNSILPPSNIINKAEEMNIPLLIVPTDTFYTAKQIDDLEILISKNDTDKVELIKLSVLECLDLEDIIG